MAVHDDQIDYARRMVALLVDGLRYGAGPSANAHVGKAEAGEVGVTGAGMHLEPSSGRL